MIHLIKRCWSRKGVIKRVRQAPLHVVWVSFEPWIWDTTHFKLLSLRLVSCEPPGVLLSGYYDILDKRQKLPAWEARRREGGVRTAGERR